jgi:lipoprotein-anchoring transpeptidase ErfK/SrfK
MRRRVISDLLLVALLIFGFGFVETQAQQLSSQERREAEQRLWDIGYWAGPVDGKFDAASRHALMAFQKVERRTRTGVLTLTELDALRNASRPVARDGKFGHVEIDLERQILFLIDETGEVMRVLPVSSGSGKLYVDQGRVQRAITPTGTFKVSRKIKGWRVSTLGLLYYPSYIHNGIAIHGSPSVPSRPASHGCIRVPMFAAKELSSLVTMGMQVEIYNGKS